MKKLVIVIGILAPFLLSGYNWNTFGPPGIVANNICFSGHTVICTNTGICINDGAGYSWNNYTYGNLAALEAIPFDTNNILLVMGNGTFPDGIYLFNLSKHQFNFIEYLLNPTFIKYCETNKTYYAGSFFNGLLSSTDGIIWTVVPYFTSRGCKSMDFYNNHIVVTQSNNIYAIYYSSDTGHTWAQAASTIPIIYLAFNLSGKLFGIYPGNSNISGLYSSTDFGLTWQVSYYSLNMNTVEFDAIHNILAGWKSTGIEEGIAKFNESTSSMYFLNDGLPNKRINKIALNPIMSSITIFCCTDSGVYFSNNYSNGIPDTEHSLKSMSANTYPNPTSGITTIQYTMPINSGNNQMKFSLYNNYGNMIKEFPVINISSTQNRFTFDVSDLVNGVYYYRLKSDNSEITKKLIIQK